jgi:hypothetical protein
MWMDGYQMDRRVLQACKAISKRLARQGAEAVVPLGSRVQGDDYAESDIDLYAVRKGPHYRLRYQDFLISISWATARQDHRAFREHGQVGGIVPA